MVDINEKKKTNILEWSVLDKINECADIPVKMKHFKTKYPDDEKLSAIVSKYDFDDEKVYSEMIFRVFVAKAKDLVLELSECETLSEEVRDWAKEKYTLIV